MYFFPMSTACIAHSAKTALTIMSYLHLRQGEFDEAHFAILLFELDGLIIEHMIFSCSLVKAAIYQHSPYSILCFNVFAKVLSVLILLIEDLLP